MGHHPFAPLLLALRVQNIAQVFNAYVRTCKERLLSSIKKFSNTYTRSVSTAKTYLAYTRKTKCN